MLGALMHMPRCRSTRPATGFTFVELMVVVAIVAVLAALALPSMRDFVARKRLEGLAQELMTDLRYIKAHQIQNRPNTGTAIGFGSNVAKVCYVLYVRGNNIFDCNCAEVAADASETMCGPAEATGVRPSRIRQVDIPVSTGITMTTSLNPMIVGGYNGMPQFNRPLTVEITSPRGGAIQVSTNPTGVPSICSLSGGFSGIRPC